MQELSLHTEDRTYVNVMESLVSEEVGQQLDKLPLRVRRYIKAEEVVTYALNRLPALYASSEKGLQYQRQLARRDMRSKIQDAVRQGIVAVQVDPLRLSRPLQMPQDKDAEAVLQALRVLLKTPDLDWASALQKLNALQQARQNNMADAAELPTPAASRNHFEQTKAWRPGTYGHEVSWHRRRQAANDKASAGQAEAATANRAGGWDDVHYRL